MKIQIENQQKRVKINRKKIRSAVTALLNLENCKNKEISITFVDDPMIQVINSQYLGKDKPTNVISFSLQEGECGGINPDLLGDIIISVETAGRDSVKGGLTFDEEIIFLIIHGFLHLTGYEHVNTSVANVRKMRRREKELFKEITGTTGL